jgi:hypothetical protein
VIRRRYLCLIVFAMLSLPASTPLAQASKTHAEQCCSIVSQALEAVGRIHKGTTRADVEREFVRDGGLFSRERTRYSFRICPSIKVEITFAPGKGGEGDFVSGSPSDTVTSVTKPYLEYPVKD